MHILLIIPSSLVNSRSMQDGVLDPPPWLNLVYADREDSLEQLQ